MYIFFLYLFYIYQKVKGKTGINEKFNAWVQKYFGIDISLKHISKIRKAVNFMYKNICKH